MNDLPGGPPSAPAVQQALATYGRAVIISDRYGMAAYRVDDTASYDVRRGGRVLARITIVDSGRDTPAFRVPISERLAVFPTSWDEVWKLLDREHRRASLLVPANADRDMLRERLEASPEWVALGRGGGGRHLLYAHTSDPGKVVVRIPAPDVEHFWDHEQICAEAAHRINAAALGLPYTTPRDAVRRLARVVTMTEHRPLYARIFDVALGRDRKTGDDPSGTFGRTCPWPDSDRPFGGDHDSTADRS